jgi:hypothetical protein
MTRQLTRRRLLRTAAGGFVLAITGCEDERRRQTRGETNAPAFAVSLSALQDQPAEQSGARVLPGLNSIGGFVVDGSDVILYGARDALMPEILLDDFVVSLRNAYAVSDSYRGVLGCSIDPYRGDESWRIMEVSVFGMPSSALAAHFVALDFELKLAGAGITSGAGKVLPSMLELAGPADLCGAANRSINMVNRYWFFPQIADAPRFERDGQDVSILKPAGVQLLTEREFLNARGERVGAADAGPEARAFAGAVTALLAERKIARYARMVAAFRVIELSQILRYIDVPADVFSHFLNAYELSSASVPRYVAGIRREEQGKVFCNASVTADGGTLAYRADEHHHRYEYRGGVEARMEVQAAEFRVARAALAAVRRRVLASRPSPHALTWRAW